MYVIINPNSMYSVPIQGVIPDKVIQAPGGYVVVLDTSDMIAELVKFSALENVYNAAPASCGFTRAGNGGFCTSTLMSGRTQKGHRLVYNQQDNFLWDTWGEGRRRLFEGVIQAFFAYGYRISDNREVERVMLLYNGIWYPADVVYEDNVPIHWVCSYIPASIAFNQPVSFRTVDYLEGVL